MSGSRDGIAPVVLVKLVSADGLSRYDGYYEYQSIPPRVLTIIPPRLKVTMDEKDITPIKRREYERYDHYFDNERGVYIEEYRETARMSGSKIGRDRAIREARDEAYERAAGVSENGRFIHDDSLEAQWGRACAKMIRSLKSEAK